MLMLDNLKECVRHLKLEAYALYLASRDPRTPWPARYLAAGIAAYALSPIDIIPDFIPVFGYLDDIILIPLGITLSIKLIPHRVLDECRAKANDAITNGIPISRFTGTVIIMIWLSLASLCIVWGYETFMM